MSSRFGTRTYTRQQKVCQSSIQFEKIFSDKNNRPSAAKSTGILHKWGKTSFTSIRNSQVNGQKRHEEQVKRPKLNLEDDPFSFDAEPGACNAATKIVSTLTVSLDKQALPAKAKPNKFFKSGNRSCGRTSAKTHSQVDTSKSSNNSSSHLSQLSLDSYQNQQTGTKGVLIPSQHSTTSGLLLKRPSSPPKTFGNVGSPYIKSDDRDILDSSSLSSDENNPLGFSQALSVHIGSANDLGDSGDKEQLVEVEQNDCFFQTYSSFRTRENANDVHDSVPEPADASSVSIQLSKNFDDDCIVDFQMDSDNSNNSEIPKGDTFLSESGDVCDRNMIQQVHNCYEVASESSDLSNHSKLECDSMVMDDVPAPSPTPKDVLLPEPEKDTSTSELPELEDDSPKEDYKPPLRKSTSTFRSRRIFNSPKKIDKKALYKHRPWQAEDDEDSKEKEITKSASQPLCDEFEDEEVVIAPLTRVVTWPTRIGDEAITSIKCSKRAKDFYTVVRNVKQAHQCHESGETQEFNDDIEYLLGGLQSTIPTSTRCLSILSLAGKCMFPAFRMHLRAHGTISKVFSALSDAPSDQNLALCTATVLFILSQDRLNMDLERSSLELMLQLLESDFENCPALQSETEKINSASDDGTLRELDRNKIRVRELCEEIQRKGHARHLNRDNISAGKLAMETLLSLSSRRAGEWFKEELRNLGGLDHIVDTINDCVFCLGRDLHNLSDLKLERLSKIDRCLRVLESVTFMNSVNQMYLIEYKRCQLINAVARVLRLCTSALIREPTLDNADKDSAGYILCSCVQSVLKVLVNITHDNALGSMKVGDQDGVIDNTLNCIFHIPKIVPSHQSFDVLVLTLGLLINLVEHCSSNRQRLLNADISPSHDERDCTASSMLVELFLEKEEAARQEEAKTNSLLDGEEVKDEEKKDTDSDAVAAPSLSSQDDLEETITKVLQKAGKHMEASIVAAYIALLIGCIVQEKKEYVKIIKAQLPDNNFNVMVQILQKFLNFMSLTCTVGNTAIKSIQRVIDVLESS